MTKSRYVELESLQSIGLQPGTKCYKRGICRILVSPPFNDTGWHVSISCSSREPMWEEIRDAWYDLVPDADNKEAVMILPRKEDYINVHKNCFHIYER